MKRTTSLVILLASLAITHNVFALMNTTDQYPLIVIEDAETDVTEREVTPFSFRVLDGMGNAQCPFQGVQRISVVLDNVELEDDFTLLHIVAVTPQAQEVTVVTRDIIVGRHDYRMQFNAGDCTSTLLIRFE